MEEIDDLASLYVFLTKLDYPVTDNLINTFDYRKKLQKLVFILSELGKFELVKNLNFSWYLQGVYSQKLADKYYKIATMQGMLISVLSTEKVKPDLDTIKKAQEIINRIDKIVKSNSKEYLDYLELFSSLIYMKNYLGKIDFDSTYLAVIDKKPKFNHNGFKANATIFYNQFLNVL